MGKKFRYAPGLPGYGTVGADGSIGLNGLALCFSSFDGTTDSVIIGNKIANNKLLTNVNENIAGYPIRTYQTGDLFIDENGNIFEIDLSETYKYNTTPVGTLTFSTMFEEHGTTYTAPIYDRWSNTYAGSDDFLLDIVYSLTAVNYTANPPIDNGIYGIGARDFAQVKFVNRDIENYNPFTLWSSSHLFTEPEKTIALVKEHAANVWRWGNLDDDGSVRNVNLYLDFENIYFDDKLMISSSDLADNRIVTGLGTNSIKGESLLEYDSSTGIFLAKIGNDFILQKENRTTQITNRDLYIYGSDGPSGTKSAPGYSATQRRGGKITLISGEGGLGPASGEAFFGGTGGDLELSSGDGGDFSNTTGSAGSGGDLELSSGDGGDNTTDGFAGTGGNIVLTAGTGGIGETAATAGGAGGSVYIQAGSGGTGVGGDGNPGNIDISAGISGDGLTNGIIYLRSETIVDNDLTIEGSIYRDSIERGVCSHLAKASFTTSEQNIPNSSTTTIVFNNKDYDTGNNYDTGTGIYTVSEQGYYDINTKVRVAGINYQSYIIIDIRKNNSAISTEQAWMDIVAHDANIYLNIKLSVTEFFEKDASINVRAFHISGNDVSVGWSATSSYLCIKKVAF